MQNIPQSFIDAWARKIDKEMLGEIMQFKIEQSGLLDFGNLRAGFICALCAVDIHRDATALTSVSENKFRTKICRTCLKKLLVFLEDNRTQIVSM